MSVHDDRADPRRRIRQGLRAYLRAGMRRRLFAWFGVTILLTGVVVFFTLRGFGEDGPAGARRELERVQLLVGDRFAAIWDRPDERSELARGIARDLEVDVTVRANDGGGAQVFGKPCERPTWEVPVVRQGIALGEVVICSERHHTPKRWRLPIALGAALMVLWLMAGRLAWRLAHPISALARAADAIGRGKLDTRVDLRGHRGEMQLLAHALNDMAARIERQMKDQRELLATVSHELRTPLTRVRLLTEIARDKDSADAATLDGIDREVAELDALVSQLLAGSRLDFQVTARVPLNAREVAEQALRRTGIEDVSAKLVVTGDSDDDRILADPTLLARALANLIENAKTHGHEVAKLVVDRADDEVRFEVHDDGPGLREGDEERVFTPFYRGSDRGNLGLGLALVRRIAEAHGGRSFARQRVVDGVTRGAIVGFSIRRADAANSERASVRPPST